MIRNMDPKNISRFILTHRDYDFENKEIININEINADDKYDSLQAVRLYHTFEYDLDLYNRENNISLQTDYNYDFQNILNAKENKMVIKNLEDILVHDNIIQSQNTLYPEFIMTIHKRFLSNNLKLDSVICNHNDYIAVCDLFHLLKEKYKRDIFEYVSIYECLECPEYETYFIADNLGFYNVYKNLEIIEYVDYDNFKQVIKIYRVLNLEFSNKNAVCKIRQNYY